MKTNKSLKVFKTANTVKSVNNIHKVSTKHKTYKKSYNKHKYVKKSLIGGSNITITEYFKRFHIKMGLLIDKKIVDKKQFESIETIAATVFNSNIVLYAFLILYFITEYAFKINITDNSNKQILTGIINDDIKPHISSQLLEINIGLISTNKNTEEDNKKLFTYLNKYFTYKDKIHDVDVNKCLNITNNVDGISKIKITPPITPIATSVTNAGYIEVKEVKEEEEPSSSRSSSTGYISVGSSESLSNKSTPRTSANSSASLSFHSARSTTSSQYLSVGSEPELVTLSAKTKERNEKRFGLHNIEDVCYITVCLQLLWQISYIRDELIDNKEIEVSGVLLAIKNLFTNIDKKIDNTLNDDWAKDEDKQHGNLKRRDVVILSDNYDGAYTFDTWPFFIEISKIYPEINNSINYLKDKKKSDAVEIMNFIVETLNTIESFKKILYYWVNDVPLTLNNNKTIQNTIGTSNLNLKNDSNYIVLKIFNNSNYDSILTNTLSPEINVNSITYKLKGCVVYESEHFVYYRYNNDGTTPEFRFNDSTVKTYDSDLNSNTSLKYITKYATIVLYERTPLLPSKS